MAQVGFLLNKSPSFVFPTAIIDGGNFGLSINAQQRLIETYFENVNLKKLFKKNGDKFVKISLQEHEKLKKFIHPNIVKSYDFFQGTCDGDSLYIIEFCQGGSLADLITSRKNNKEQPALMFSEWQVHSWLEQLTSAVKFIHNSGYLHRNVQPKNFLLANVGDRQVIKMCNFNLAEAVERIEASENLLLIQDAGFWPYLAPELWLFKRYTEKCDMWSVGVIAYELANLKRPFPGDDPGVIAAILFNEPESFSENCSYSEKLNVFIMKLLEKDPDERLTIDEATDEPFLQMPIIQKTEEIEVISEEIQVQIAPSGEQEAAVPAVVIVDEPMIVPEFVMRICDSANIPEIEEMIATSEPPTAEPEPEIKHQNEGLPAIQEEKKVVPVEQLPQIILEAVENGNEDLIRDVLTSNKDRFNVLISDNFAAEHPIHRAARLGKLQICKLLTEEFSVPVDLLGRNNNSPLNEAAANGRLEIVRYLALEKDANVENRGAPNGRTPFLQAVANGHLKIAELLSEFSQANVEAVDDQKSTAIHLALEKSNFAVADFLLRKRPEFLEKRNGENDDEKLPLDDPEAQAVDFLVNNAKQVHVNQNRTPLLHACYRGNVDAIKFLVERGANLEERSNFENYLASPIHLATIRGHLGCVDFLLKTNPTLLESGTLFNDSPLNIAASQGHFMIVEYLVNCRLANIEKRGILGRTPLMQAATNGHLQTVKFLAQKGANLRALDENLLFKCDNGAVSKRRDVLKSSAIHLASENGHLEVIDYLLKIDSHLLKLKDSENGTALNRAASSGKVKIVKFLISHEPTKANVENRGFLGRTALLEAAINGHLDVVECLVRDGRADLLAKDGEYENTALHLAATFGQVSVVAFLIDAFAGQRDFLLALRNSHGMNAMSLARMEHQNDVVQLLEQRGASF